MGLDTENREFKSVVKVVIITRNGNTYKEACHRLGLHRREDVMLATSTGNFKSLRDYVLIYDKEYWAGSPIFDDHAGIEKDIRRRASVIVNDPWDAEGRPMTPDEKTYERILSEDRRARRGKKVDRLLGRNQ